MKLHSKNKGKVHPSPSPTPSSLSTTTTTTTTAANDPTSALKLLPAAIFALITVLSLDDQEVLAYMITRSLDSSSSSDNNNNNNNTPSRRQRRTPLHHTPPVFQCGCFDCYTSYWFRWDSSPNRDLIHHAIDAFDEHLSSSSSAQPEPSRRCSGRGKRKSDKKLPSPPETTPVLVVEEITPLAPVVPQEELPEVIVEEEEAPPEVEAEEEEAVVAVVVGGSHKGLARKVLPDVIGLFNSRFWSLWSPNA